MKIRLASSEWVLSLPRELIPPVTSLSKSSLNLRSLVLKKRYFRPRSMLLVIALRTPAMSCHANAESRSPPI